jgi:hypothetical protein
MPDPVIGETVFQSSDYMLLANVPLTKIHGAVPPI